MQMKREDTFESNMENFITRYANQKGYTTRECYTPIKVQEVPEAFKHKYSSYDEYIDALADYINGY